MEYPYLLNPQNPQQNLWEKLAHTPKIYAKNEMIYLQGEYAESFYYLKKGRVKIFLSSENGGEKTITVLEKENIFGEAAFFDGLPRMSSAKALVKSEIIAINHRTLPDYFRREPSLAINMLQFLSRRVRLLSTQLDHMTFLQADKRIAQLLVGLASETGEGQPIVCTHEEIGSLVGTSRVTVSKILSGFAKRGWIRTQYHGITIQNKKALSNFAFSQE